MDAATGRTGDTAPSPPAQIAKAALRRLMQERLEPTPQNFARAYQAEAGSAAAAPVATPAAAEPQDGEAWAALIERTVRGLERSSRQWTAARKKESLHRVLGGSRSDARRLQQRLGQLVASWDGELPEESVGSDFVALEPALAPAAGPVLDAAPPAPAAKAPPGPAGEAELAEARPEVDPASEERALAWPRLAAELGATVQAALPPGEPRGQEVAAQLAALQRRLEPEGPAAVALEIAAACVEARRVLQHRHHLIAELGALCRELTEGLGELSEDDSWVQGQCDAMRRELFDSDAGLTARGLRSVGEMLHDTRARQRELKKERSAVRDALRASIQQMLQELAELGSQTGRFTDSVEQYAETIGRADSLESLAGAVRELVAETRGVHQSVTQAQSRLAAEHERARAMQTRVVELEDEIRRLSSEVSTDPLTQVANRRGLLQAFETEQSASERGAQDGRPPLAVALIDIDHFKKLNDRLGHANGDAALQFLTQRVKQALRPSDTLARYGGEEFVVLLPETVPQEAQQVLTRLQRSLSAELFMSDAQGQVFVTFSAGVTSYRAGERIEQALERADEALYEAKRSGRNRTCVA